MIELPWPPAVLSPNSRAHWRRRHAASKKMRAEAYLLAKAARIAAPAEGDILVRLILHPPVKRDHDRDNGLARCKALLDGIADALEVNDRRFVPTLEFGEVRKGGAVIVTVGAG